MKANIKKVAVKLNKLCNYRFLTYAFGILFAISLLPVIYISFFDYASGDDLGYGALTHQVIAHGGSIGEFWNAVWKVLYGQYMTWGGNWASTIMEALEPSIWGEKVYVITPFIALFCICYSQYYLLKTIFLRVFNMEKYSYLLAFFLITFFTIQYMPRFKSGLFWYTGMIPYIVPYALVLFCTSWLIKYLYDKKLKYIVFSGLAMIYVGGAGYPEAVLAIVLLIIFVFVGFFVFRNGEWKKNIFIAIPLIIELISLFISVIAPGNKVRGGGKLGFSVFKLLTACSSAICNAVINGAEYFFQIRPLILLFIALFIISFELFNVNKCTLKFRFPVLVNIVLFLIYCSTLCPQYYAGNNDAGFSGGVYDSYYFSFVFFVSIAVIYDACALKRKWLLCAKERKKVLIQNRIGYVRVIFLCFSLIFVITFYKHLIGNSLDYSCINYIHSGELADYEAQMQERIAILENPAITDVVLPEMNPEQGPLMHMALLSDPNSFTNRITKNFYGKNSVIAIPRDEYQKLYGIQ